MSGIKKLFQSAPVISDGRSLPSVGGLWGRVAQFQSAPVISDGRSRPGGARKGAGRKFQSAPVISDGRSPFAFNALVSNDFFMLFREPIGRRRNIEK
jgi:hypothetical protein